MVEDAIFAAFLDALTIALRPPSVVAADETVPIGDLLSSYSWPAAPSLSPDFDVARNADYQLVTAIHGSVPSTGRAARATLRRSRARFDVIRLAPVLQDFARDMIETDPDLPDHLADHLNDSTSPQRLAAIFFTIHHARGLMEMIRRRRALIFHYEEYCALSALETVSPDRLRAMATDRAPRVRNGELHRARNRLERMVSAAADHSLGAYYTHQLFIERQLTALLDYRLRTKTHAAELVLPPLEAPRAALLEQAAAIDRVRETVEEARAALERFTPDAHTPERQQARDAVTAAEADLRRAEPRLRPAQRHRIERYRAALADLVRLNRFAPDRNRILGALDRRLGLPAGNGLLDSDSQLSWRHYDSYLDFLANEGASGVNTQNFSFSFLAACAQTELTRDIELPPDAQHRFDWITRPGHRKEAVDLNGPSGTLLHVSAPPAFGIPMRFPWPPELSRLVTHESSRVIASNEPDERHDVFAKLVRGLLGDSANNEAVHRFFAKHADDPIAPQSIRGRAFSSREIGLIFAAMFSTGLTAHDNLKSLGRERDALAADLEREIAAALEIVPAVSMIIDRSRLVGGPPPPSDPNRRYFLRLVRGSSEGHTLAEVIAALRRILNTAAGMSRTSLDRTTELLDRLWLFLLAVRRALQEPDRNGGSLKLQHRYSTRTLSVNAPAADAPASADPPATEMPATIAAPLPPSPDPLLVEVTHAHLYEIIVPSGDVTIGRRICRTGSTGGAINAHLHIEVELLIGREILGDCYPYEFFPNRPL